MKQFTERATPKKYNGYYYDLMINEPDADGDDLAFCVIYKDPDRAERVASTAAYNSTLFAVASARTKIDLLVGSSLTDEFTREKRARTAAINKALSKAEDLMYEIYQDPKYKEVYEDGAVVQLAEYSEYSRKLNNMLRMVEALTNGIKVSGKALDDFGDLS